MDDGIIARRNLPTTDSYTEPEHASGSSQTEKRPLMQPKGHVVRMVPVFYEEDKPKAVGQNGH